jgi:hypothetical protein
MIPLKILRLQIVAEADTRIAVSSQLSSVRCLELHTAAAQTNVLQPFAQKAPLLSAQSAIQSRL